MDHASIFAVIASSYSIAPVFLPEIGIYFIVLIWTVAIYGMIWCFKVPRNRNVAVVIKVCMGSLFLLIGKQVILNYTILQLTLQIIGFLSYLLGVIVYIVKWPDPWPNYFGYHEIWHLFTILGAYCVFALTNDLIISSK